MILTAEALAFDMDGTLVDSGPVIAASWTGWAARRGLDPAEVIRFCHGRPLHRIIAHFAPDADLPAEGRWVLDRLPALEHLLRPVAGAPELLAGLDPAGEWALVTSAPADLARRWMGICDLPLPRVLVTADDVTHPKPDPEPFARAAHLLGQPPGRMLAFEDSTAGLASATAAGMATVGLGGATGTAASIADYTGVRRQPGPAIRLSLPG
ncbi:MAG: HAD-IA family hydrolase [Paracoccus sp. (in: a-proteobacteria)]